MPPAATFPYFCRPTTRESVSLLRAACAGTPGTPGVRLARSFQIHDAAVHLLFAKPRCPHNLNPLLLRYHSMSPEAFGCPDQPRDGAVMFPQRLDLPRDLEEPPLEDSGGFARRPVEDAKNAAEHQSAGAVGANLARARSASEYIRWLPALGAPAAAIPGIRNTTRSSGSARMPAPAS